MIHNILKTEGYFSMQALEGSSLRLGPPLCPLEANVGDMDLGYQIARIRSYYNQGGPRIADTWSNQTRVHHQTQQETRRLGLGDQIVYGVTNYIYSIPWKEKLENLFMQTDWDSNYNPIPLEYVRQGREPLLGTCQSYNLTCFPKC